VSEFREREDGWLVARPAWTLLENADADPGENFPETDIEPELELRLLLMKLVRQLDEDRALPVQVGSTTLAMQEERELASKLGLVGPQSE
jgi:hypothetical protein